MENEYKNLTNYDILQKYTNKNHDNHLTVVFYILINCVEFCTDKYGYILL